MTFDDFQKLLVEYAEENQPDKWLYEKLRLSDVDGERWRFCMKHGFPVNGPQAMAFIDGKTAALGGTVEEAVDRAIEMIKRRDNSARQDQQSDTERQE